MLEEKLNISPINTSEESIEKTLLNPIEARVLGVLMEKQQTTPDQYPLTLNSVLLGCNQKSSRLPKMQLSEGDVGHELRQLEIKELVRVDRTGRADRFEQKLSHYLHLDNPIQAIFQLLLLRGPQTINELYTRSQRAYNFINIESINDIIVSLLEKEVPLITELVAKSGQRENRYAHLLCGEVIYEPEKITIVPTMKNPYEERMSELEKRVNELEEKIKSLL
jgi:uncharacterized protein YceH (UPF0502 family)